MGNRASRKKGKVFCIWNPNTVEIEDVVTEASRYFGKTHTQLVFPHIFLKKDSNVKNLSKKWFISWEKDEFIIAIPKALIQAQLCKGINVIAVLNCGNIHDFLHANKEKNIHLVEVSFGAFQFPTTGNLLSPERNVRLESFGKQDAVLDLVDFLEHVGLCKKIPTKFSAPGSSDNMFEQMEDVHEKDNLILEKYSSFKILSK